MPCLFDHMTLHIRWHFGGKKRRKKKNKQTHTHTNAPYRLQNKPALGITVCNIILCFTLPFRVSCSARMMSIREFSRECMLKPSNDRVRSCGGGKGKREIMTVNGKEKKVKAALLISHSTQWEYHLHPHCISGCGFLQLVPNGFVSCEHAKS